MTIFMEPTDSMIERLTECMTCGRVVRSERNGIRTGRDEDKNECCKVGNYKHRDVGARPNEDGSSPTYLQWCNRVAAEIGPSAFVVTGSLTSPTEVAVYRKVEAQNG